MENERVPLPKMSYNKDSMNVIEACNSGYYVFEERHIDIKELVDYCLNKTNSYPPDYEYNISNAKRGDGVISITKESTTNCIFRLTKEKKENICALNFANPFTPGGGWLDMANAQEETLCRSSALAYSLFQKKDFYKYNIELGSNVASDYIIYSPKCPFWKINMYQILPEPYIADVITSAAVAQYCLSTSENKILYEIMETRIRKIIECCVQNNARNLVLGAFGCGVFRNDPTKIASIFKRILLECGYINYFDSVTFAINGRNLRNLEAFSRVFGIPIME